MSQGGEEARSVEEQSETRNGGWGGRERRYKMGRRGVRDLKTRVGRECSISRRGARLYSEDIHVGGVRGGNYSVTSGDTAGGKLQE